MMYRYWYYPWGGFGLLGLLPMLLFWLVILFILVRIFRHSDRRPHHWTDNPEKTPLDILKERYARGKIDKKQYEEMKKDLNDGK